MCKSNSWHENAINLDLTLLSYNMFCTKHSKFFLLLSQTFSHHTLSSWFSKQSKARKGYILEKDGLLMFFKRAIVVLHFWNNLFCLSHSPFSTCAYRYRSLGNQKNWEIFGITGKIHTDFFSCKNERNVLWQHREQWFAPLSPSNICCICKCICSKLNYLYF